MLLPIIIFGLIISVLVLIHEFGHFYTAKRLGIGVEEFGFGIPPRVISKKIGETVYSLNLLPFGGFVKLHGDEDSVSDKTTWQQVLQDPKSYLAKSPGQRLVVIVAGVLMNLVLAIVLFYVVLGINGFKTQHLPMLFKYTFRFGTQQQVDTVIMGFAQNSPAKLAGAQLGDAIIEINRVPVRSYADVRAALARSADTSVSLLLMDVKVADESLRRFRTLEVQPTADPEGNGLIGVVIGSTSRVVYATPREKLLSGVFQTYNVLGYSLAALRNLTHESVQQRTIEPLSSSVSGPVGIFSVVKDIVDYAGKGEPLIARVKLIVSSMLDLAAVLSVSLAFINILPIPALDGGRAAFVLVEAVTKKRLRPAIEDKLNRISMLLLFGLILLITLRDIKNIF